VSDGRGLQPFHRTDPATRVLGSNHEEGRSPSGESFARVLSTRATATSVAKAWLVGLLEYAYSSGNGIGTAVSFSDDDRTLAQCARAS
jgi:hypothetical protein